MNGPGVIVREAQPIESVTVSNVASLEKSGLLRQLWQELLVENGSCWGRVTSNSMYPMIKEGDRILVEKVSPKSVRFGDIIVFRRSRKLVIHRILGRRTIRGRLHFLEKGDGNLGAGLVPVEDMVARVRSICRPAKTIEVISGLSRALQVTLALYFCATLWLWTTVEPALVVVGHGSHRAFGAQLFRKLCVLPPAVTLKLLRVR